MPCHAAPPAPPWLINVVFALQQHASYPLFSAYRSERTVDLPAQVTAPQPDARYFDSNGVEKAVLLARYTDILQTW